MVVGWVAADRLGDYLDGDFIPAEGAPLGIPFAGHLVAITFDSSKNKYCVISD